LKDINIVNGLMRDIRDNDAARTFPKYLETAVHEYIKKNPNPEGVSIWDLVDIEEAMQISPSVKLQNYIYKNNGDYSFEKVSDDWGLVEKSFSNGSAYADLDNDGDLDLVINNINDYAFIYQNNAEKRPDNHFLRVIPIADQPGKTALNTKVWIEAEGEKQYFEITSIRGMYSTSEHIAHFGLGAKKKVEKVIVEWPDGKRNILKNQRSNRIIEVKYSNASFKKAEESPSKEPWLINATEQIGLVIKHNENRFDDFEKQLMLPHKFSDRGPCFEIGDVNGDGLEDIFMGGSARVEGRLFNQNPDGSFGILPFPDLKVDRKSEDIDALFLDVDSDGDLDLYVVSGGNEYRAGAKEYQDRLYLNDGKANFSKSEESLPKLTESGARIVPADYDQDGDIDLFIAGRHTPWEYPKPVKSTLLRNDGGKFEDVTNKIAKDLMKIGMVNDAVWVDYDNDGLLDLALAGEWMPFTILKNDGSGFKNVTADLGLENTTGCWFSIKTADMDQDGDPDFILGNLGLNYEYKASKDLPFHVFYYDFDN
ncbi:MAG: VCBS repeat-containing protein, partial [Cyclobacteriaceae bacterium]|nr:VCBS repeat-containing protein [Cyclobacteriaceae bacterium]